jgi:hypothetical protein
MGSGFKVGDLVCFNSSVFCDKEELLGIILGIGKEWVRVQWIDNPLAEKMPIDWVVKVRDSK